MKHFPTALTVALLAGCSTLHPPAGPQISAGPPGASPASTAAALPPNTGSVSTVPGTFDSLEGIATDAQDNLYVLELDRILKITPGGVTSTIVKAYNPIATPDVDVLTNVSNPLAIAAGQGGMLYVLSFNRIYTISQVGRVTSVAVPEAGSGLYTGLAADSHNNVFVSIDKNMYGNGPDDFYIGKLTPAGQFSVFAGQAGVTGGLVDGSGTAARFDQPGALTVDAHDNLYVADIGNLAIRKVTPDGMVSTLAGKGMPSIPPSPPSGQPSPDLTPLFQGTVNPRGLAVNAEGVVYFSSPDNRVYRLDSDGKTTILAGDGTRCPSNACQELCQPVPSVDCSVDGTGVGARFNSPNGLAMTSQGSFYVREGENYSNMHIRKIQ